MQLKTKYCSCELHNLKNLFYLWDFLVVQWLRLRAPEAGGLGSIAGQGSGSHMPQKRIRMPVPKDPRLKIPCAATKTWHSRINIKRRRICSVFNELKMNVINLLLAWPHAMKALRPKEI